MPASKFVVTGLPRSRTAWMAAFLSTGETLCLHEPSYRMMSIEDLNEILDTNFYKHIGVSESGLGFFAPWILENLQCRMLVIERDFGDVERSMRKFGFPPQFSYDYCAVVMESLLAVKRHPLVKWVHFNSLVNKRVMQDIYWWLMPGMAFDEARWTEFEGMKIEADINRMLAKFQKYKANIDSVFAELNRRVQERQSATTH